MRYITLIPTFVIAFILQISFINSFAINGIVPNLLLCLVLIIVFLYDLEPRAILAGTIAAFFLDIMGGRYLGVYALSMFIIGLLVVAYKHFFNFESKFSVIPLGIGGTILYHTISCGIMAILGINISIVMILKFLPIAIILNIIVMYILYFVLIKKAKIARIKPKDLIYERYDA